MNAIRRLLPAAGLAIALAYMAAFSDLGFPGHALRFTGAALTAGFFFWIAATRFNGSLRALWLGAVIFRVILLWADPADDAWRYIWEGRVQQLGFNPYVDGPLSPAFASQHDRAWEMVNHKEFAAAYPPGAQLFFQAMAAIGATSLLAWKMVFAALDLGVVALLIHWVGSMRAIWYAWNPLPIFAFAGAGHFDVLMLVTLVGSALLLERGRRENSSAKLACSSLLLGLAIAIKVAPIVFVPVWFFGLGWRRVGWLLPALLPLPLLATIYGWPGIDVFAAAREFARVARTNDAVWWLSERFVWANAAQKNDAYQLVAVAACAILAVIFRRDWPRSALWVLGAALLLSPALHPWYLTWLLPFAVFAGAPARGWILLSVTGFFYFMLWTQPVPWSEPDWMRLAIFLPPLAYAIIFAGARDAAAEPRMP